MPRREHFAGRVAALHLPYLDGAVMDSVHHLPPSCWPATGCLSTPLHSWARSSTGCRWPAPRVRLERRTDPAPRGVKEDLLAGS